MLHIIKLSVILLAAKLVYSAPIDTQKSDEYLVDHLPGLETIPEEHRPLMHAGHIEVDNETDTNYFFWKFVKPNTDFNRTIIWLNGGPGCSSMDGALMETGPLRVHENGSLYINDGSWYQAADMIFVDQPGGTGFSITKSYDRDLDQVGDDFVKFLINYFAKFPEDSNNEIYLAGESYAGQYIPFIAASIFNSNDLNATHIDLKGLLIGNGWIAPNIQSLSYLPYMMDTKIISTADEFFPNLLKAQEKCQNEINSGEKDNEFSIIDCEGILNRILSFTRDKSAPKDQQCLNMYDTRLRDSYPSCGMNWPPALPFVEPYLKREEVVESLNLNTSRVKQWRECDGDVSKYLTNKHSKPSFNLLPDLLKRVEIMLFNGDKDIICNNRGVKDLISQLHWGGSKGFSENLEVYDWKYNGEITGSIKGEDNLTFVEVFESSHMVPFDKPYESRGLFDIFVGNFKIVETSNATYVETPVYSNITWSNDGEKKDEDDHKSSLADKGRKALPFIFYLGVIGIIGCGLYVYNKGKPHRGNSILRKTKKHSKNHKKRVSWADEEIGISDSDYKSTAANGGKFGEFFNNFRSNGPSYQRTNSTENDEYEDIELQSALNAAEDLNDYDDFEIDDELEDSRVV